MSKLVLGLGYGIIDIESGDFVDYGVRLFKEGTAVDNQSRREARSHRRLLRRNRIHLEEIMFCYHINFC